MRWQILCDFDGTISTTDTLAAILDRFATPEWREIDKDVTGGQFGSLEARRRQTALLCADEAAVRGVLDSVEIDPGFTAFLDAAGKAGLPVTIVSDGYELAVRHVFDKYGIRNLEIVCNQLAFEANGSCTVTTPNADKDCAVEAAVCKCAALGRLRNRRSVLIGNGFSDFCTAGAADFVFAKADLAAHCRAEGFPNFAFHSFDQLTPLVGLIAGDGAGLLELAGREAA